MKERMRSWFLLGEVGRVPARDLVCRGAATAFVAIVVCVALAACTSGPDLGESVKTLVSPGSTGQRESAARRVAASLNASACADVAAAASSDVGLAVYIEQMRSDLLDSLGEQRHAERRIAAIRCIQALGVDGSAEALGWTASGDESAEVRLAAAEALATDDSDEAADALFESIASEWDADCAAAKAAAATVLPDAMDRTIAAYEASFDASETARIAAVARSTGAEWVDPLAAELSGEHASAAQGLLAQIGEPAVDKLVSLLRSKKYAVRQAAAETLATIERGAPGTVERLMASIASKDYKDVARYYLFYIKLGQPGTEKVLRTALLKHGTKSMALDYLNCGNNTLESAAKTWASRHGYVVVPGIGGGGGPTWGEGL